MTPGIVRVGPHGDYASRIDRLGSRESKGLLHEVRFVVREHRPVGGAGGGAGIGQSRRSHRLESIWTAEHSIFPRQYASRYPYSVDGKAPVPVETPMGDCSGLIINAASTVGSSGCRYAHPARTPGRLPDACHGNDIAYKTCSHRPPINEIEAIQRERSLTHSSEWPNHDAYASRRQNGLLRGDVHRQQWTGSADRLGHPRLATWSAVSGPRRCNARRARPNVLRTPWNPRRTGHRQHVLALG